METQEVRTSLVDVLRPTIGRLTDEVLASVTEAVPPFEEWWGGRRNVRDGVRQGLHGFLELLEAGPPPPRLPGHEVFFDFGRSEQRAGRSPGAVLAAYRAGAQAACRGCIGADNRGNADRDCGSGCDDRVGAGGNGESS